MLRAGPPGGFSQNFPGDVAYAYKANSSVFLLGALYGAGIRHFDVASIPEIEDAATIPGAAAALHAPGQVAHRHPARVRRVRRAQLRARQRGRAEEDRRGDRRLPRPHPVGARGRAGASNSKIPLERKYGVAGAKAARLLVKARQAAKELGITFHVGSQTATPEAYTTALDEVGKLIARAGRGARPARRRRRLPVGLRRTTCAGAAVGLRARHRRGRREAARSASAAG